MKQADDAPPAPPTSSRRRRFVLVASAAAALDLATKTAASAFLPGRLVDLPGPMDLQLSHNPGVAFGLGTTVPAWLLVALTATVTVCLAVAGWRGAFTSTTGAGLVLGGATANLANRLQAGSVVDMLHLGWWPTFNLADASITVGVALLLLGETHLSARRAPVSDSEDRTEDPGRAWTRREGLEQREPQR